MLIALCFFSLKAEANGVEQDARSWHQFNVMGPLPAEKFRYYVELQPRFRDELTSFDLLFFRPAIYYELSKKTSIWLGYLYGQTYSSPNPATATEHRLWQQLLTGFDFDNGIKVKSQTRFEQRTFEGSNDIAYRFRQKVGVYIPSSFHPKLRYAFYDEVHFYLNNTDFGAVKGFEQNRFFLGLDWKMNDELNIEGGYMNQYFYRSNQPDIVNHVIQVLYTWNF
jgi:hypothetical protein